MDEQPQPPWEAIHPSLTGESLLAVAMLIARARQAKIARRTERDSNWNIGCDCHQWALDAFHVAAADEYKDWLTVESRRGDLDLVFRIKDGPPIKFFRPDADGQPYRTLRK